MASGAYSIQLALALLSAVFLFGVAFALAPRISIILLIVLAPFELIDSRFGSINIMLIYLVSVGLMSRGHFKRFPLAGGFIFLLLAYILSMTQALSPTWFDHGTYMLGVGANILFFYLTYNLVINEGHWRSIWKALISLNIAVLVYCLAQLIVGPERFALFGISELELGATRADARLTGPFNATAMTAEYLVTQVFLLTYAIFNNTNQKHRMSLFLLILANCFFLVTTGNRGGLIILVVGLLAFLFMFRRQLGLGKSLAAIVSIIVAFTATATIAVKYTDFDVLFERLQTTEIEGYLPDTRQGWTLAWDRAMESPILGHGPRLRLIDEFNRRIRDHEPMFYPHSAPLYLIYTIGFIGLAAYLALFALLMTRLLRARKNNCEDSFLRGLPRLGLLLLFVIGLSELRMEMFRFTLFDYQNFVFALFGAILAAADLASQEAPQSSSPPAKQPLPHYRKKPRLDAATRTARSPIHGKQ